jgi:anaerobic magnesium-protoporphyrin IX monomethyl ester cyclase
VHERVDVLLTHSYHLAHDAKQWRKMQPYPPLGTLYAATALRAAGISVAVFDPMFDEPVAGFEQALAQHQPSHIVIYEDDFNFVTKMCLTHMRDLACTLATMAHARGLTVIAHGSDATDHPAVYFAHGVRYILNGEAEQTLTELCAALLATGISPTLPGLIETTGVAAKTPPVSLKNPSWATLPPPARDLLDLEPYRAAWTTRHGFFSTNLVASRGCPFQCNWCAKPISGNRFQLRPATAVAAEIQHLKSLGVQHLWFSDDVFALDRHWVEAFAAAVEVHGTPLPFKIQSRADLMSEATVDALRRAGCTEVWMGVESGSQKILNAMTKGLTLAQVDTARRRLKGAGIRACFFLQLGYPGEAWPEILETIDLVRTLRPDDIGVSLSYPLPGTLFYDRVEQQLGPKRNWADSDDLCNLHIAAYRDTFYHALRDALHAEINAPNTPETGALWSRVHALEPTSRNTNVLTLTTPTFLPLTQLTGARRTA